MHVEKIFTRFWFLVNAVTTRSKAKPTCIYEGKWQERNTFFTAYASSAL